jgi:tetratricopeptide (TPR) repeat protein
MKRAFGILLLLLAMAAPRLARAEEPDALVQMKAYFNAGAEAYELGDFSAAIQAFEQAYRAMPRPAILFSLAQAERRHYVVSKEAQRLASAIAHLRAYLAAVQEGGRRKDAADILAELEALAARAGVTHGPPAADTVALTRLMVSSATKGARVSIDSDAPRRTPAIVEVEPGKHVLVLVADGYFEERREVLAVQGNITALDLVLREKPGQIFVSGTPGAVVYLDAVPVGTTPTGPLATAAGRHVVSVAKNGCDAWTSVLDVRPGEGKTLSPTLHRSVQRTISYGLFPVAGLAVATGAAFTLRALAAERETARLMDAAAVHGLTPVQRDEYNEALDRRNGMRTGAIASYAGGAALAGAALGLFLFDTPSQVSTASIGADAPPRPAPPAEPTLSASPLGGGFGTIGGALNGRF